MFGGGKLGRPRKKKKERKEKENKKQTNKRIVRTFPLHPTHSHSLYPGKKKRTKTPLVDLICFVWGNDEMHDCHRMLKKDYGCYAGQKAKKKKNHFLFRSRRRRVLDIIVPCQSKVDVSSSSSGEETRTSHQRFNQALARSKLLFESPLRRRCVPEAILRVGKC